MNILLVNNYSIYFSLLKKQLSKFARLKIVMLDDVLLKDCKSVDAVVLSGGGKYNVSVTPNMFSEQYKIVKSGIPVLGVCLGFQIICHAFGEPVIRLPSTIEGRERIRKVGDDQILKNIPVHFNAQEGHSWGVKTLKKNTLVILAKSNHCIEAVRHKSLPVWGVQFHPEASKNMSGARVIHNFIEVCKKKYAKRTNKKSL